MKKIALWICSVVMFVSVVGLGGMFVTPTAQVNAAYAWQTEGVFEMQDGASLRLSETNGLRFIVKMDEGLANFIKDNDDVEFGFVIAPQNLMEKAIKLSESDVPEVEAIHSIGEGWVGDEALAIATYSVLKHPDNVKDSILCAVNHKGDSDSTGAIAGNMIGAYLGFDAIPSDWVKHIELKELLEDISKKIMSITK
jgi:hypothetical protein